MFDVDGWVSKYEAGLKMARELAAWDAVGSHLVVAATSDAATVVQR
jgi:hypothetical protein